MGIKSFIKLFISAISVASGGASYAQVSVPQAVKQFYGGMEDMLACSSATEISELEISMNKCFFGYEDSGMNLPNDFRYLEIDADSPSHDNKSLTSNNYINKLSKYIYLDKSLKPSVKISSYSRKTGTLPYFDKRLSAEDAYVMTVVRKTFSYEIGTKNEYKEFLDTVYTHIIHNKISVIVNGLGSDNNPELLKVKAAQAYEAKRFDEAYKIFQRIIELDRSDSEPLYRLALMTYYGKGCKSDKRKGRLLMEESSHKGSVYGYKADLVLRNWKYRNVL